MCAITLSILPACNHEVPTIEYCSKTTFTKFEKQCRKGLKPPVPSPCIEGIGWAVFTELNGPVECEGCRTWLALNGKKTYHDLTQLGSEHSSGHHSSNKTPNEDSSNETTDGESCSTTEDENDDDSAESEGDKTEQEQNANAGLSMKPTRIQLRSAMFGVRRR